MHDHAHHVHRHLERAEQSARGRAVALDASRSLARDLLLDELSAYRRAGRFPVNDAYDVPRPCFIDDTGTPCALAHLMIVSGAEELAREIASSRKYAFVSELVDIPELTEWLSAGGLTLQDAIEIQPSYCPRATPSECLCAIPTRTTPVARGTRTGDRLAITAIARGADSECADVKIGDRVPLDATTTAADEYEVYLARDPLPPNECRGIEILAIAGGVAICQGPGKEG